MTLSHSQMLDRMYASDDTCNGHFITGVMSTKIYCLPSCSARKPKADNVKFFLTQEDARSAGLRACKRCRPDDFYAGRNPELERLMQLVERIRRCPAEFESVEDIASRLETGVTKAHQLFREHYHLRPRALLSQARINSACKFLLQDASALDAAFDAGFESASAFHENFRKWTGLTPAEYRGLKSKR